MEETNKSKTGSFWAGVVLAIPLFFAINLISQLVMSLFPTGGVRLIGGLSLISPVMLILGFLPILIVLGALLLFFFIFRKYQAWRYFMLGIFTAIGAGLIFAGTCFAGGIIGSQVETGEFAGMGGLMLSLPFAIGFAIWFLIAIGRRLKKTSEPQTEAVPQSQ